MTDIAGKSKLERGLLIEMMAVKRLYDIACRDDDIPNRVIYRKKFNEIRKSYKNLTGYTTMEMLTPIATMIDDAKRGESMR